MIIHVSQLTLEWHVVGEPHRSEVMNDSRFATNTDRLANRGELAALLQDILSQKEADHWLEALRAPQNPSDPTNSVPGTLAHPQLLERGFSVELEHARAGLVKSLASLVHFSDTPVSDRLPPPALGHHNSAVLGELGFTSEEIGGFAEKGII